MYKLSKCFNTTLKFLNKSWISQLLWSLKLDWAQGYNPNKTVESEWFGRMGWETPPTIKTSSWIAIKVFVWQYVTISIYTTPSFLAVNLQVDT